MAAGRHLGFRFWGHNFWTAWARHFKFGTGLEIHERNMAKLPKLTKIQIQHGRRPTLITRKHWACFQNHWVRWYIQNISAKRISTFQYSPILCVHVPINERNAFLFNHNVVTWFFNTLIYVRDLTAWVTASQQLADSNPLWMSESNLPSPIPHPTGPRAESC